MSFHEKSAWACLVSIVVVFAPYFLIVLQYPMAFVALFGLAVMGLAVLLTGFHIANALMTRSIRQSGAEPPHDELDQMIELRAAKLAGIVLAATVLVWSIVAMFGIPAAGVSEIVRPKAAGEVGTPEQFVIPVSHALVAVHLLFGGFVIANVAYYARIVVGYRRLACG